MRVPVGILARFSEIKQTKSYLFFRPFSSNWNIETNKKIPSSARPLARWPQWCRFFEVKFTRNKDITWNGLICKEITRGDTKLSGSHFAK